MLGHSAMFFCSKLGKDPLNVVFLRGQCAFRQAGGGAVGHRGLQTFEGTLAFRGGGQETGDGTVTGADGGNGADGRGLHSEGAAVAHQKRTVTAQGDHGVGDAFFVERIKIFHSQAGAVSHDKAAFPQDKGLRSSGGRSTQHV